MSQELPCVTTLLDAKSLRVALTDAWRDQIGGEPCPESITLLLAHIALETGLTSCKCWNLGNAKAAAGGAVDWTYFKTWERVSSATAKAMATASTDAAPCTIVPGSDDGTHAKIVVAPKHPACCFRAYESLEDGIAAYFNLEYVRFAKSWQAVLDGDPAEFARQLKAQGYYTATEASYENAMVALFKRYQPAPAPAA